MDNEQQSSSLEWSFNIDEARKHLLAERDDLLTVIRGHLYVEHVLIEFMRVALQKPTSLTIDRVNFITKLEICAALGAVSEDQIPAIRVLNRLRNKAAHDLTHRVSERAKKELFDCLPPVGKELVFREDGSSMEKPIEKVRIGRIILVIVVLLDSHRDSYAKWLAGKEKAVQNLINAVENLERSREEQSDSDPTA